MLYPLVLLVVVMVVPAIASFGYLSSSNFRLALEATRRPPEALRPARFSSDFRISNGHKYLPLIKTFPLPLSAMLLPRSLGCYAVIVYYFYPDSRASILANFLKIQCLLPQNNFETSL